MEDQLLFWRITVRVPERTNQTQRRRNLLHNILNIHNSQLQRTLILPLGFPFISKRLPGSTVPARRAPPFCLNHCVRLIQPSEYSWFLVAARADSDSDYSPFTAAAAPGDYSHAVCTVFCERKQYFETFVLVVACPRQIMKSWSFTKGQ